MTKAIIYSDLFLPTFPYLELPLFNELKNLGIEVIFVLQNGDYRLINDELKKVFGPVATILSDMKNSLRQIMNTDDLLIMRFV